MPISEYPKWNSIELDDFSIYREFLEKSEPQFSECSFGSLFAWKDIFNYRTSVYQGSLLISMGPPSEKACLEPIAALDQKQAVSSLLQEGEISFFIVTERTAKRFENDQKFTVGHNQDKSDYIYNTQDLILLKGKKYDAKRNYINRFGQSNNYEYLQLNEKDLVECLELFDEWCKEKGCKENQNLIKEKEAYNIMVANLSKLGLVAGGIRIEGKLSALCVGGKLNSKTFVIHMLKAKGGIQGLNQTVMNEFIKKEASEFEFINMEEDLGEEGLRKFKKSYHPCRMEKKYMISLKGGMK